VGPLAEGFLSTYAAKHGRPARRFDAAASAALSAYDWPGNVRELANVVERAVIVAEGAGVGLKDLPESVRAATGIGRARRPTLAELEAGYIREVLEAARGNKSEAARVLGISRKNLYERLARQGKDEGGRMKDEGKKAG
jgi:DNA-binding NtrC family response regulator